MAQEVNTLTTNNTASSGFFGGLFTGLGNLITAAAPVAANVYQLKLQADTLSNQSAQQLAQIQLQQQKLLAQQQAAAASGQLPGWFKYAAGAAAIGVLLLVLIRLRRRSAA